MVCEMGRQVCRWLERMGMFWLEKWSRRRWGCEVSYRRLFSWQSCDKPLLGLGLARQAMRPGPGSFQVQDISVIQQPRLNLKKVVIDLGMNKLARPFRKKPGAALTLTESRVGLGTGPFAGPPSLDYPTARDMPWQ